MSVKECGRASPAAHETKPGQAGRRSVCGMFREATPQQKARPFGHASHDRHPRALTDLCGGCLHKAVHRPFTWSLSSLHAPIHMSWVSSCHKLYVGFHVEILFIFK